MVKILLCLLLLFSSGIEANDFDKDTIPTSQGNLVITFIGHGSLMFSFEGKTIHIDPFSRLADYSSLPKADLILVTHNHGDHFDTSAINKIRNNKTIILLNETAAKNFNDGSIQKNGETKTFGEIKVEAVPAYNIKHKRDSGDPFHVKGDGNGYVITFANKRVYIAGDTENIPEMKALKNIDIAFLPMNLPYTMTPEMVADAAKAFKPTILYPYHFGDTDINKILELMKEEKNIEIRIRKMK